MSIWNLVSILSKVSNWASSSTFPACSFYWGCLLGVLLAHPEKAGEFILCSPCTMAHAGAFGLNSDLILCWRSDRSFVKRKQQQPCLMRLCLSVVQRASSGPLWRTRFQSMTSQNTYLSAVFPTPCLYAGCQVSQSGAWGIFHLYRGHFSFFSACLGSFGLDHLDDQA